MKDVKPILNINLLTEMQWGRGTYVMSYLSLIHYPISHLGYNLLIRAESDTIEMAKILLRDYEGNRELILDFQLNRKKMAIIGDSLFRFYTDKLLGRPWNLIINDLVKNDLRELLREMKNSKKGPPA
jgi:hypothetical protein